MSAITSLGAAWSSLCRCRSRSQAGWAPRSGRERRSRGESAETRIEAPPELERYLVEKGSLAVDGISLTVYGIAGGAFSVALIPYTLQVTNVRDAQPGSLVNLEADVIAKYVERLLAARGH
jgi:riboflavin synthase